MDQHEAQPAGWYRLSREHNDGTKGASSPLFVTLFVIRDAAALITEASLKGLHCAHIDRYLHSVFLIFSAKKFLRDRFLFF
jgi:hypothetical protein